MDKTVLIEKRKNLLNQSKGAGELYLNSGFIDLTNFIEPQKLINFMLSPSQEPLVIQKGVIVDKIKVNIFKTLINVNFFSILSFKSSKS